MSLIIPANSLVAANPTNSLRFNSGSSDYLSRTVGSGGSTTTGTISFWLKRGDTSATQYLYANSNTVSGAGFGILLSADKFYVFQYDGTSPFNPANYQINLISSSVFRDYSAWYHFVLVIDTSNGTEANRIRLYVNGIQQTLNKTGNEPTVTLSLNVPFLYNGGVSKICSDYAGGNYFGGYMAETYLIDGQALTPTDFGEFDEDSGVWKPIAYEGTYGTNGFFLEFQDSGALGTDTSGEGNNFTVNNLTSIDQTTDTPTNNFATWNPLEPYSASTFSNGNLTIVSNTGNSRNDNSTLGVSQGKWYWETKYVATSGSANWFGVGAIADQNNYEILGDTANGFSYYGHTGVVRKNGSTVATLSTFAPNDIIGVALDLDNNLVYFYKNGTVQNSGTGISIPSASSTPLGNWFPAVADWYNVESYTSSANFGNPPFTIASGNADANGLGNFEYTVPTGYLSLCTKNLSEVNS